MVSLYLGFHVHLRTRGFSLARFDTYLLVVRMKRFVIVIATGLLTGLLVYNIAVQVLAASQPVGVYPIVVPQTMSPLLSTPLLAGIFWLGLFLGEFSAGLLALKLYSIWSSRDTPEDVQDDSLEIQKLFDLFLTN